MNSKYIYPVFYRTTFNNEEFHKLVSQIISPGHSSQIGYSEYLITNITKDEYKNIEKYLCLTHVNKYNIANMIYNRATNCVLFDVEEKDIELINDISKAFPESICYGAKNYPNLDLKIYKNGEEIEDITQVANFYSETILADPAEIDFYVDVRVEDKVTKNFICFGYTFPYYIDDITKTKEFKILTQNLTERDKQEIVTAFENCKNDREIEKGRE